MLKECGNCKTSCINSTGKDIDHQTRVKAVLVGAPNVGKSALFSALTGVYATISNYPGTTVEIVSGKISVAGRIVEIIDTPGMYSLSPITEEERVAKEVLFTSNPDLVVHVVDSKNLKRSLPFTFQLIEAGFNIVLVLNMADEAERSGITISVPDLENVLSIPVLQTVATKEKGIAELANLLGKESSKTKLPLKPFSKSDLSLNSVEHLVEKHKVASTICLNIVSKTKKDGVKSRREQIEKVLLNSITALPILILVMFAFYQVVGVFGAQVLVNWLEVSLFRETVNPTVTEIVTRLVPWVTIQDLLISDYGILTLGFRYAIAIVLPIVGCFFLFFSLLEDSGYLPRMALLLDSLFKKIGLSGRSVIPIVLGFGCATMATLVTRTLETKRERLIATFLLALAIPCSAQLGVILGLLSSSPLLVLLFVLIIGSVFFSAGFLLSRLLPGKQPLFYLELPPLRVPSLKNIFKKTSLRVWWYLKEILPIFILASIIIWIGQISGLFNVIVKVISHPVALLGLPKEAATAFFFGFFRRDFGAAGLYDLVQKGVISEVSLFVASVTLALFMPCIAQLSVTIKERGAKTAVIMAAFIFPFAFLVGWLTHMTFVLGSLL